MKKLASVVLCLLMVAALAVTVFAAQGATFSMTPASKTLGRGEQVTLTVNLSNDTAATSYGLKLSYDKDVFEIVEGAINEGIGAPVATFDATKGFAFMFTGSAKVYSGNVGTVTFKVKDDAAFGTYTISGVASVKNGSQVVTANNCSATIKVECAHSYGAWTEAADGHQKTCSKCGDVQTEAHKWNSGVQTKAPTCVDTGVKTYTCSTCKATKTETIDALGHKEGAGVVTKEATCKEEGVRTFSCTVCKEVLRTETIPTDDAHKFGNLVYVDENNHKDVCSICNQEVTLAHKWDNGVVTKEETCKDEGVMTYTCTGCKGTKTEVIPVNEDHKFDSAEFVDENSHKAICSVCEKEISEEHSWDEGVVTTAATCQTDGEMLYTCSVCNGTKTEVIVASEEHHVLGPWTVTVQPTYDSVGSREAVCTLCETVVVEELPKIEIPATGDNFKLVLWVTIMALSACALVVVAFVVPYYKGKFQR